MENATIVEVSRRLNQANLTHSRLRGEADSAARRSVELETKVGVAKGRLALADEVTGILDELRNRAHARSVGAFEKALSGILADLFPEKGDVVFDLQTKSGLPALDILIRDGTELEDVMDDSGGAVTNVLSTGLQYAALSRTKNRRLMVLDEPDCWVEPALIRNFVQVIAQVSKEARTQTFLVSHHPTTLFEGLTTVVKLAKGADGVISATKLPNRPGLDGTPAEPHPQWSSDDEPGIRSIEAIDFGPHIKTKIEFGPGVTSLVGVNDLGKSKLMAGTLRAVGYGESVDRMIRRGAAEAKIIICVEGGKRIEWIRQRKGSPKVLYAIYEAGNDKPIFEGRPPSRGEVPEAIVKLLNIAKVDQLDVQISAQKDPVFLLGESPSTRAQLLSVGRESGHLVTWFETYKDWQKSDKDLVKTGEIEYAQLKARLATLGVLDTIEPTLTQLIPAVEAIQVSNRKQDTLFELEGDISHGLKRLAALTAELAVLDGTPELPQLTDTRPMLAYAELIERLTRQAAVEYPDITVEVPELYPTDRVVQVGKALVALQDRLTALESLTAPIPEVPELFDLAKLDAACKRIEHAIDTVAKVDAKLLNANKDLAAAEAELEALKATFGNRCPLCDAAFPDKGIEHAHK